MKCQKCGRFERDDASYCGDCGALLDHDGVYKNQEEEKTVPTERGNAHIVMPAFSVITDWVYRGEMAELKFQLDDSDLDKNLSLFHTTVEHTLKHKETGKSLSIKLICVIETDDTEKKYNSGIVKFFIYIGDDEFSLPIESYETACSLANAISTGDFNFAHLEVLRKKQLGVLHLRVKACCQIKYDTELQLLDDIWRECWTLGLEAHGPFLDLASALSNGYEVVTGDTLDVSKSNNTESDSNTIELPADELKEIVNQMLSKGAHKTEVARVIFHAMPNSSRGEVISTFIKLGGLTPAGASTYYSNIKKGL